MTSSGRRVRHQDQRSGAGAGRAESESVVKRGQQEYVFPTQVVRVTGNECRATTDAAHHQTTY